MSIVVEAAELRALVADRLVAATSPEDTGTLLQTVTDLLRVSSNPALKLANPTPKSEEAMPFRSGEVEAVAHELGKVYGRIAIFGAETGLRPAEWIALEWRDIDRTGSEAFLRVERQLPQDATKTKPPKTKRSRRQVPLTPRALEALDDLGGATRHIKLCFPGPSGGYIKLRNWRRDRWSPALIAAGFVDFEGKADRSPYALRHTYATNMLRAGWSTFTLSRRMGTSMAMIDDTYGHLADDSLAHDLAVVAEHDARHLRSEGS